MGRCCSGEDLIRNAVIGVFTGKSYEEICDCDMCRASREGRL